MHLFYLGTVFVLFSGGLLMFVPNGAPLWELIAKLFSGTLLTGTQVLQSALFVVGFGFLVADFPVKLSSRKR